jgi:DNA-binding XRE family transcriptional regulator
MITNERQYAMTRAAAARFAQALAELDRRPAPSPAQRDLERSAMQAQLADLGAELAQYEALRDGGVDTLLIQSLVDVPRALICARVAAGLTQKQLAERLGVREQQVQQDEATEYAGAGLDRLHAIASVLGVTFTGAAHLPKRGTLSQVPTQAELLGETDEQPRAIATRARNG